MRQGALLPFELEATSIKREFLTLQAAPADGSHEPPELSETYAPQERLMKARTVLP